MSSLKILRLTALLGQLSCRDPNLQDEVLAPDLVPVPAGLGPGDPYFAPQPHRDHPYAIALSLSGDKLYVALRGNEAQPGREVAVLDARSLTPLGRIEVGLSPNHLALHPNGRHLVVCNRFSGFLSVIDTQSDQVVQQIPTPYYATELLFDDLGTRAWISNRWLDLVLSYDVEVADDRLQLSLRTPPDARLRDRLRGVPGIPVGTNPRALAYDPASARLFVANLVDLEVSVIDTREDREVDRDGDPGTTTKGAPRGVTRLSIGAPVNDLLVRSGWLYVATVGAGTGHPADQGPDTNGDGLPGDGTANLHFHDLQNELATYDALTLAPGPRYTSDSIVGILDDAPEGIPGLPEPELRIVRGALPEQLAEGPEHLYVVTAGSAEVSRYRFLEAGRLAFERVDTVGLFPYGAAVDPARGEVFVANRLTEDITRVDVSGNSTHQVVGDVKGGAFPATDAELGEVMLNSTALYTVDGDATCEHCHREGGGQRRVASAPHGRSPFTMRSTPTMKYLQQQRPLMFENFLDETNFSPMMNEFGRAENFGPGMPRSDYPDRDTFYLAISERYLGRSRSFGDALPEAPITFEQAARLLGLALIHESRALPNPNPKDTFAVARGKMMFESAATGCANCHPAPEFTLSRSFNPAGLPLGMRMFSGASFDGQDIDALSEGAKRRFGAEDHVFGVPTLRGLWDRPEHFYHDGRASSLVEALATPDHPALAPDEEGLNVRDGVFDIHGGTSHLDAAELADLIEYLRAIE